MVVAGLDGCKTGWVVVTLGGGPPAIDFIEHVSDQLPMIPDRAAIDIPIGLPDFDSPNWARTCDLAAREKLKPYQSRVFTGARRRLWDFASAAEANKALKANGQPGISLQLWNIGSKITQVDAFVQSNRDIDIREAHPEVVFMRLNGDVPLTSKKTADGVLRRMQLLAGNGIDHDALETWLTRSRMGRSATIDDVLDACACAIAARDFDLGFCLPAGEPPKDACELPMQIWY